MCVCKNVCLRLCLVVYLLTSVVLAKGVSSPRVGFTGHCSYKPCDLNVGNWTWVLWKFMPLTASKKRLSWQRIEPVPHCFYICFYYSQNQSNHQNCLISHIQLNDEILWASKVKTLSMMSEMEKAYEVWKLLLILSCY